MWNEHNESTLKFTMRCGLLWLIAGMILLLFPLLSRAASLSLDYNLGFNGHFHLGSWTPFTITLDNRGRTVVGTLEVIVTSGSELDRTIHQTTYAMNVELPYNSTKLCAFTVLISSFTHDLIIHLRQGDTLLLTETINLREKYAEKRLAVVLDERITPDFLTTLPQSLFTVNAHPRFLPDVITIKLKDTYSNLSKINGDNSEKTSLLASNIFR